jgi:hypothetical protein
MTNKERSVEEMAKLAITNYKWVDGWSLTMNTEAIVAQAIKAERQKREEVVEYITSTEPAPDTQTYIDLVKNGNKDDMYDYGVKIMRDVCVKALNHPNNK